MGWEGWAPPMFFDRDKIIIPVVWRFSFIVFFQNFVSERHGMEEFRLHTVTCFSGDNGFKTAYV